MLINCPYCGPRPVEEFTVKGDASPERPRSNEPSTMDDWYAYVFLRDNVKGRTKEFWHHSGGCRSWLVVERDTLTHEVYSVTPARDVARKQKRARRAK